MMSFSGGSQRSAEKSRAKIGQSRMVIRAGSERPVILALGVLDSQIVDACLTHLHRAVLIELPIFVAIRPKPISRVIMPFVGKADGDTIALENPTSFATRWFQCSTAPDDRFADPD